MQRIGIFSVGELRLISSSLTQEVIDFSRLAQEAKSKLFKKAYLEDRDNVRILRKKIIFMIRGRVSD